MKARIAKMSGFGPREFGGIVTAILLSCGSLAQAQVTGPSPVGIWDCTISGSQGIGLAYLTFEETGKLSGFELLTPKPPYPVLVPAASVSVNPREDPTDWRMVPGTTMMIKWVHPPGDPNYSDIEGRWTFDVSGHVIGSYTEAVRKLICTTSKVTNLVEVIDWSFTPPVTNYVPLESTVTVCRTNATTNTVGFQATVVPGTRLTMLSSTPNGNVTYRGRPANISLANASGSWYGTLWQSGQRLVEFFDVGPGSFAYSAPWVYAVSGQQSGYYYDGVCMVSSWGRIGFCVRVFDDNSTAGNFRFRSVVGPFYPGRMLAITQGELESDPDIRVRFNAKRLDLAPAVY